MEGGFEKGETIKKEKPLFSEGLSFDVVIFTG